MLVPSTLSLGVVPVLVGPLQALLALLPVILASLGVAIMTLFKPRVILNILKLIWAQKLPLLGIALLIVGLFYSLPRLFPESYSVASTSDNSVDSPMFRGGPERRSWVPGKPNPAQGGVNWRFKTGEIDTFYSSPTVVGDYVYAVSGDITPFNRNGTGRILCLDADTGEVVWKDQLKDFRATFASPAVSGNYLVCGEGLHLTSDARVVCLDARTGETLWEYRTNDHVESSPCIYDGKVYVGAGDEGGILCFALEPNPDGTPNLLWHRQGSDFLDAESSPVAADGKVIVGLGIEGHALVCLDANTGEELWRVDSPYPVFSSPAIENGVVYVGKGTGNFIFSAEEVWEKEKTKMIKAGASAKEIAAKAELMAPIGIVSAIDAETGQVLWEYNLERTVLGAISIADGNIYFGSSDNHVYRLSKQGELLDKWNTQMPIKSSLAVGEDFVYCVAASGILFAVNRENFDLIWQEPLYTSPPSATDYFVSSPVLANGQVYVGTPADGLVSIGQPGEDSEKIWAGAGGGPGYSGKADTSAIPESLSEQWFDESIAITGPIAYHNNAVYAPGVMESVPGVAKINLTESDSLDSRIEWFFSTKHIVKQSPVLVGDQLFIADGNAGESSRMLYVINTSNGDKLGELSIGLDATGHFTYQGGLLLIEDKLSSLSAYELLKDDTIGLAFSIQWQIKNAGKLVGIPDTRNALLAFATEEPNQINLYDLLTGLPLWQRELSATPTTGPIFNNKQVWVGTNRGLLALNTRTGNIIWELDELGPISQTLVAKSQFLAALSDDDPTLHLVNTETGEVHRSIPSVPVPPLLTSNQFYFAGSRGMKWASLADAKSSTKNWLRWEDEWGAINGSVISVNSRIYIPTELGLLSTSSR